ncbi:MAG TPA: hypothetical protein VJ725_11060 [Thermoanaerobaculia bacterium]|nr:hypothetical protein [Thermoanaerobaculia bacterium]
MAGDLPGDGLGVLELRLGPAPALIDLSIRLREASQARRMAGRVALPHLRSFLTRWPEGVLSLWLEFDLDREPDPVPCVKLPPDASPSWIADSLLPQLHGKPLAREQRDRFLACHREIPAPGHLLYVFSLLPRGIEAVRMEVYGLEIDDIQSFLGRIAPDSLPRISGITPLFAEVERLHLSFDIAPEGILPRIGLEGSFPRLPRREPRWAELFGRLTQRGLCSPDKGEAVLAWPGSETFWTAPAAWPVETVGARGFCVRGLSHVKVVSAPDREPEAKAYLSFGYAPINPRERGKRPDRPPDARSSPRTAGPEAP